MDREPEAWQSNATRPSLTVGEVGVMALGDDQFLVAGPSEEHAGEGFDVRAALNSDGRWWRHLSRRWDAERLLCVPAIWPNPDVGVCSWKAAVRGTQGRPAHTSTARETASLVARCE